MKRLPNLPIGLQYLEAIRKNEAIYIDKTEYIYEIAKHWNSGYFLSRPRRFGKSLTVDTMAELFEGNRILFKGLWIEDKWDWSETFPVIRLSLDTISHDEGLYVGLLMKLQEIAEDADIQLVSKSPSSAFAELIKKSYKKTGKPVVILIDEYDKPISDYIDPHHIEKAKKQTDILKKFFSILKDSSKYIRFLFITGISKFAKVSIFSELNHLVDLTLNPDSANMFGYTQSELEHHFKDYLEIMPPDTLEKMKYWYDGYSWDGKNFLYNPFSVLNFFYTREYRNYWFSTGTPTILMKLMHRRLEYQLEETEVSHLIMEGFRIDNFENLNLNSLLLQTGYLTIKKVTSDNTYILNYPNEEVRQSFAQFLLSEYTTVEVTSTYPLEILRALRINDLERVRRVIHFLIQAIPDHNYIQAEEKFLHAVVHLIFTMVGTDVRSEVHTPTGRIDTIVVTAQRIFLFEFKIDETADDALKCIEDRNYVAHLRHHNKDITAIGVSFDSKKKGIGDWKAVEVLKI